jgi:predicted Zn-dependent protease
MKIFRLNLNILIIALILTINTPEIIFAQNNSRHQKPKSTTTRYQNLYDNSSTSTLSEASDIHYKRNTKSNDRFLDEYRRNKNKRYDYHTDRDKQRKLYTNSDNFNNRNYNNKKKDYSERQDDKYSSDKSKTENYFHIDRTGRTLWDGKHWEITDFPLKIYVKASSSGYYKSAYKTYVKYAMNVWRKADDRINYIMVNSQRDADISVIFIEDLGKKYDENYLGLTEYDMNRNKVIEYSKIQISLIKFGDEVVSDGEIKATIIHELGHAFGLGHSNNEYDIMYPYISPEHTTEMNYDELSQGDKGAIKDVIALGDEEIFVWK